MPEATPAAAVILAAGESTRMGEPKVLLPFGDGTVLGAVIASAASAGLDPIVVVTGFNAGAVGEAVPAGVHNATNLHPERGTGSSLDVGLASVDEGTDVVVLLADMPGVDPAIIASLVSESRADGSIAGRVRYTNGDGHPIFLSSSGRSLLGETGDDRPLWSFLNGLDGDARTDLEVDTTKPLDLNAPEDYRAATSIGFDEFMRSALYDAEHGFFAAGPVRAGRDGDFITSPEVSPWFGRLIGRWALSEVPKGTHLFEVGAGTGSLLEPLLDEAGSHFASVTAVEWSRDARDQIRQRLPDVRVTEALDLPAEGPALVVANELLDNMPSRLVERTEDGWIEWRVTTVGGRDFVAADAPKGLAEWCDLYLPDAPIGCRVSAQVEMASWIRALAGRPRTRVIAFDYAASTAELCRRAPGQLVRTFRRHREGVDPLGEPGSADLTVEVNWQVAERAVESAGGRFMVSTQADFLGRCGARDVLEDLRERERMQAAAGDAMAQLAARSESVDVRALLDERGLGGFMVLDVHSGTHTMEPSVKD